MKSKNYSLRKLFLFSVALFSLVFVFPVFSRDGAIPAQAGGQPGFNKPTPPPSEEGGSLPSLEPSPLYAPQIQPQEWRPPSSVKNPLNLPLKLKDIYNSSILAGLTQEQVSFLLTNGFVVMRSQEEQFHTIRKTANDIYGQPYFLTTDAAYHALHQNFDQLLKALEYEQFIPRLSAMISQINTELQPLLTSTKGTEMEADAHLAAAYMAVAGRLLGVEMKINPSISKLVDSQIQQVMDAGGRDKSVLIPNFEDDYSAYKPVSHYTDSPELEAYFRTMTWFGRVHFRLKSEEEGFTPSRAPLILTLAIRKAGDGAPATDWKIIHETLSYLIGPLDDLGPAEYAGLMDKIYSPNASFDDLADEDKWAEFLNASDELPPPQINSTFVGSLFQLGDEKGWRFMGQRFTLDALILQNLVFDKVSTRANPRWLPSGLDVMAAFGSPAAKSALEDSGQMEYEKYPEKLQEMTQMVQDTAPGSWMTNMFSSWLNCFIPQIQPKELIYPSFMQTQAWLYKDLNSALGSWAELKHDTALYAKMPEAGGGGGPPGSGPAPAYVEPNPDVFYRLAAVVLNISEGLKQRGMDQSLASPGRGTFSESVGGLVSVVKRFEDYGNLLQNLGKLAEKEIRGETLNQDEWGVIGSCLGGLECQVLFIENMNAHGLTQPLMEMPPAPVVAAVAGAKNDVLEVANGYIDRIFVLVSLENKIQAAQGGVFSYFEFSRPRNQRLNDDEWIELLKSNPPARPEWAKFFSVSGGSPTNLTAFRIGDVYKITEAGNDLNNREKPSKSARVLDVFQPDDYVAITDGPVQKDGYTWWKMKKFYYGDDEKPEGWSVENQEWYERAIGQ